MADFDKGTLTHLSLSSDGRLSVAPALKEVYDPSVAFLWAVARDSKGNLYTGGGSLGGSKAKLFAIDSQGRGKLLAELDGIAVQAIAIDRQDRIYAATSPDGKVYRVDASGKAQVFYDPKAKYIWALAFARSGDLYIATGGQGEIHRVTPAGAGSVFFRTEETHARSLAIDASDNLIVGTEPGGLILRVTPAGAGFVLYQTPKREITAVAVAQDGTIYAAATGNRQVVAPLLAAAQPASPATATASPGVQIITIQPTQPTVTATPAAPTQPPPDGSEIYRIQTDGYPRRIWNHTQDLVYTLAFDASGRLLAGTGNRGMLYRLDNDRSFTRLLNVDPTQITGLASAPDGRVYAVTGNIGKVLSIGPATEISGTIESDVLDAGAFSYWGRLTREAASGVVFETRSGNLSRAQQNWSPWTRLNVDRVASPAARFLQYRATLSGPATLSDVRVAYEMKNVAPVVDAVEITPPNYRFPAPVPGAPAINTTLELPPLGRRTSTPSAASDTTFPTLTWAKGQIGARWLASDDNGDTLEYKVEIRGVNETAWKLLRDKVRERYFSWDSTAFPDGKYVARITATDSPSNPPDQALSSARESEPFLIDNTPPEISISGAQIHVKDTLSNLGKAEYSINGGDWMVVEPTTRLTDSNEHDYRVPVSRPAGEASVSFRVEDAYGNQAVARTVLK
jgi:outer membrane protein assembly factor BamB